VKGLTRCRGVRQEIAVELTDFTIGVIMDRQLTIVFALKMLFVLLVVASLSHCANANSNARSWVVVCALSRLTCMYL
jgi:hypothetical protein